jgi:hypothetical protein
MLKVELHHLFFGRNHYHNKKGNTRQSIEKRKKKMTPFRLAYWREGLG